MSMSTLPLKSEAAPSLPAWRAFDDRWQLRSFDVGLTGGLLGGTALAGFGAWITLGALRLVPFDLSGVRVPLPVFATVGAIFALAGLTIATRALTAWARARLAASRRRESPGDHALVDHPWDPEQSMANPWSAVLRRAFWSVFLALFFTPAAWLFFQDSVPLLLRLLIAVFGLVVLWLFYLTLRAALRAAKFGFSVLLFPTFPLRPGSFVDLRWRVPRNCRQASGGHFTLRVIEERLVRESVHGRRRVNRTRTQLWATRLVLTEPVLFRPHDELPLSFALPADAPGTWLAGGESVRFWELAVELDLEGLDFRECYLVPVYHERSTA